jgi:hypothetical protein
VAAEDDLPRDVLGRVITPHAEPDPLQQEEPVDPAAKDREEDDALLASLDEETAEAIRVMRRLSPVKKRVSELLEEYRATQLAQQSAPKSKKKSWWTRG